MRLTFVRAVSWEKSNPPKNVRASLLKGEHPSSNIVLCAADFYRAVCADLKEVDVAHDASIWSSGIPHNEAGAMAPLASNAALITANVFGGNFFRHFHIGTADWLLRLVKDLTAS